MSAWKDQSGFQRNEHLFRDRSLLRAVAKIPLFRTAAIIRDTKVMLSSKKPCTILCNHLQIDKRVLQK